MWTHAEDDVIRAIASTRFLGDHESWRLLVRGHAGVLHTCWPSARSWHIHNFHRHRPCKIEPGHIICPIPTAANLCRPPAPVAIWSVWSCLAEPDGRAVAWAIVFYHSCFGCWLFAERTRMAVMRLLGPGLAGLQMQKLTVVLLDTDAPSWCLMPK